MSAYLIGIDIGTSACKAALFSSEGRAIARAERGYETRYPRAGFAEQEPEDWWRAVCESAREIIEKNGVSPRDIAGVGVDGQSWGAAAVDKDGNALAPSPIWTDTRARAQCAQIAEIIPENDLFNLCGNPLMPGYTLPKILWYRDEAPDIYRRAAAILQVNSYIVYRLTGRLTQDISQGYGLQCFDMRKGQWDEDMIRRLGIRAELLPPIIACHEIVGGVTQEAARLTGLRAGTPVVAGGLDAACGTLGAGVTENGQTQEQSGQAGGMSACMDSYAADQKLILGFHVVPGRYLLQGGTTGGGGALKWLREQLSPALSFEELSAMAAAVPAGSEGLLFLPYMAGERSPIWNPDACGAFFGLGFGKTTAHLIRAVMEGVAFSLRHNLETAQAAGAKIGTLRAAGGGTKSETWMQIKASVTGKPVEIPQGDCATARGASMLAGVGTGLYRDFREAASGIQIQKTYLPDENAPRYDKLYQRYLELYERLAPMMRKEKEA